MNVSGVLTLAVLLAIPATVYLSPSSAWRGGKIAAAIRRRRDPLPSLSTEEVRVGLVLLRARATRYAREGYSELAESNRRSAAVYERALELRGEGVKCGACEGLGRLRTYEAGPRRWTSTECSVCAGEGYLEPVREPARCTHEGGEWPGLERCADCGQETRSGEPQP